MTTTVLVLGAGFGGLELSTRLSEELGDQVEVTLIDRAEAFVFGFSKLDVMFGKRTPEAVRLPYRGDHDPARSGSCRRPITSIDPAARRVTTDRDTYEADVLVVALGADYDLAATPGLAEAGHEFYSVAGAEAVRELLPTFRSGTAIVGVCGAPFKCPPAPSETALLLDELPARERGPRRCPNPGRDPVREARPAVAGDLRGNPGAVRRAWHRVRRRTAGSPRWTPPRARPFLTTATACPSTCSWASRFIGRRPSWSASGMTEGGWIPVDKHTLATRFPGVYAVGDVTSVGTPKAGVFAEGAARVVADQLIARIRGEIEPPGYDGTGACCMEFGDEQVARIDVDFFSTPGHPTGTFTPPSAEMAAEKAEFGASRRIRWFGGAGD